MIDLGRDHLTPHRHWTRTLRRLVVGAALILGATRAAAQPFPEPSYRPDPFTLPPAETRTVEAIFLDAQPADAPMPTHGYKLATADYLALLRHLNGEELSTRGAGATVGSQYMHVGWESGPDATLRPIFTTTLTASDGEKAQVGIPLALSPGESPILRYDGAGHSSPAGSQGKVRTRTTHAFEPMKRAQETLQWVGDQALVSADDEGFGVAVPLAPRPFAILDVEVPPVIPADSALVVRDGVSHESIFLMPDAPQGHVRLFLFAAYDSPAPKALRLAWVGREVAKPPQPRVQSTIVTRYEILSDVVRLTSERHYEAPEGSPITALNLVIFEGLELEAIRCSVPADYDRDPPNLLTVRPRSATASLDLVVVARHTTADFTRTLHSIVDGTHASAEEIIIESPGMNSYLDSGAWGLAEGEGPMPSSRRSAHSIRRHYRALSRRAGIWSVTYHNFISPFTMVSNQNANVLFGPTSIRVREDFRLRATSASQGRAALRQPVQVELDPRADPETIGIRFEVNEPTTQTLTLRNGIAREDQDVRLVEFEWEKAPQKADFHIEYTIHDFLDASARPAALPVGVVVGAQLRGLDVHVAAPDGLIVLDEGDFTVLPAKGALNQSMPMQPEPTRAFELREVLTSRAAAAPRLPVVRRAPAVDTP